MKGEVIPIHLSRFLQIYNATFAQVGIKLVMGFDFYEYVSITQAIPTKGPTFPNFRPDRSSIRSGEGYWIIGLDKNNDVALTNATRLYDLSHSNFAEHLESLKAFYADPTVHAHPRDRCTCKAPGAKKMTGKVAYNGDLWVRKDFRGQGMPKIIARIIHSVAFAMWAPDFLCALVARWRVDKGLPQYHHYEPGGSILRLMEENVVEDNWLVWATYDELRSEVSRYGTTELLLVPCLSPVL